MKSRAVRLAAILAVAYLPVAAPLISPQPASAAGGSVAATRVTTRLDLAITLTTQGRILTGHTATFAGTAPAALNGHTVALQRRVGKGPWVTVGSGRVSSRKFTVHGIAISYGSNAWRARSAVATLVHLSAVSKTAVWKWFRLDWDNQLDHVDVDSNDGTFYIGSRTYPNADWLYEYGTGQQLGLAWNLNYKCALFSSDYGVGNYSDTGAQAHFGYDLDGASTDLGVKGLGQPSHVIANVSSHLRITLHYQSTSPNDVYTQISYPNSSALCRAAP